jgi:peptide/nickel transport system substrate-binding protein
VQNMRKVAIVAAPLLVGAIALSACGSSSKKSADKGAKAATSGAFKAAKVKVGGTVVATIEKDVADFNTATSTGNTFDGAQVVAGVFPGVYNANPELAPFLDTNLVLSTKVVTSSPEVIEYKVNPKAVWSDGVPIDVADFEYTWKALNGVDNKTVEAASTTGYEDIASIVGADSGKTVTVTFKAGKEFADWQSLFAPLLPAHYMTTLGKTVTEQMNKGMLAPKYPKISGGPYIITGFTPNDNVKLARNDKYWGPKPPLDTITFKIITDAAQEPTALQNGEVNYIYPQPQVDLISSVKAIPKVKSDIGYGLLFEHFDFNLNTKALKDLALRKALFTAIDRKEIIKKTVGQFDPEHKLPPLGSRMLLPTQTGYKDSTTAYTGDVAAAKKILTDAGYTGIGTALTAKDGTKVGKLRMRYTVGNKVRQSECELFAAAAKQLGVTIDIQTTDSLGDTLDNRDFDVIVFAWVGTPFPFTANKALYVTGGGSNYDAYTNKVVDDSLTAAAKELDAKKAADFLNTADQQISDDAVTLPLYQKATFLAVQDSYANIVNNSTNAGPAWNIGQWGVKAT